jgi:hypothetical protein
MPRYFFHFNDGKRTFTDTIGVELDGMANARKNAIAQIREMKSAGEIQDWSGWKMAVINIDGKIVFEIDFALSSRSMN